MKAVKLFLLSILAGNAVFAQCPTVVASSSAVCSGTPVQLNASAGFTTYAWTPASGLSNATIANPVASVSGNYTVTATTLGPNLVVNPDFSAGNTGFTSGQTYSINYTPCDYFVGPNWFNTNYTGMTDHTPSNDNMYMNIDGCTSLVPSIWEETIAILPNTNYTFGFWASRADQVQPTFEIHFTGNASGNNILNTTPGIPYVGVWTWDQYGVPFWNSGSNTSVDIRVVNLQTNGYGNDFGLDDFSFQEICTSTDSIQVTIAPSPNLGPDTSICGNASVVLNAGNANSYLWNTGATTQNITVNSSGQYSVITTINNCNFTDTTNVTMIPVPVVNLGNDTTICSSSLPLDATYTPESTYLWNTGSQSASIVANSTGTYSVIVSLSNCIGSDSIHINVSQPVNLGSDISLCGTLSPQLDAGNIGTSFLWSTGSTAQVIDVNAPGEYWVQVVNASCVTSDTVEVSGAPGEGILFIPNTFTPNNNGVNDKFYAYGEGITDFHMRIFNRWGQLIFETTDPNLGWDGTYKGELVQVDTYVYSIDYKTECYGTETKKSIGHVNVLR